jgi:Flp pilus assembly protein TadG
MANETLFANLRRRLRELRTANAANVTVTFALATIPMVGFVGAAVDYSHANAVKAAMQMAADSTALMLSKVATSLNSSDLQTKANAYFNALFTRTDAQGLVVTAVYNTGNQVIVNASSNVKTNFMGLMGFSSLKVAVDSQVKWGNSRLRVALVLDNTGSMADDNKMSALKTATNSLLTQLKNAAVTNGDVYVSIVPFVKDVNVNASNYSSTWIDWTDWNAVNGSCSISGNTNQSDCQADGVCSKSQYTSQSTCNNHNGTWTTGAWTPKNHNTWNGCVVDRGTSAAPSVGNYDTNVTAPTTATTATLYSAEQYSSCPTAAVLPLSYDWTGMSNLVNNMTSNGNTNQAIGLQLGWMSLVGGGPFATPPTMDPKYQYSQIIILLTDGLNTQDRWYTDQTSIDNRQKLTCANAKAAGITLYMVQVNTGGDPTSTLLQQCASSSDKFFLLTSASQMVATFQQIGVQLSNLRIAQ